MCDHYLGEGCEAHSAGRSNGWVVVDGLPDVDRKLYEHYHEEVAKRMREAAVAAIPAPAGTVPEAPPAPPPATVPDVGHDANGSPVEDHPASAPGCCGPDCDSGCECHRAQATAEKS